MLVHDVLALIWPGEEKLLVVTLDLVHDLLWLYQMACGGFIEGVSCGDSGWKIQVLLLWE